jgi:hypothetical protein
MPAVLVIAPGASEVEQNSAETGLSQIDLHKSSTFLVVLFDADWSLEPATSSPKPVEQKTHIGRETRCLLPQIELCGMA